MAIIETGQIGDFNATLETSNHSVKKLNTVSLLEQATRSAQSSKIVFEQSPDERGLSLSSILLKKDFEGFLANLFSKATQDVYFTAWAWDMSGNEIEYYPGIDVPVDQFIIPLQQGETRSFMGKGITLFNRRKVTGGISVRIQIWESDRSVRNHGKTLEELSNTIKNSKLNSILSLAAKAGGLKAATVVMVKDAALELTGVVGKILQANSDDYVDFFAGDFPVSMDWTPGETIETGYAANIGITKF